MGASIAWLAVETENSPALFEAAQVEPTEELDSQLQVWLGRAYQVGRQRA